jgi:hypothetical protein
MGAKKKKLNPKPQRLLVLGKTCFTTGYRIIA